MSKIFHPGQQLTEKDLCIKIKSLEGYKFDPFYIRYSIYEISDFGWVDVNTFQDRSPIKKSTGEFFSNLILPIKMSPADYCIEWSIRQSEGLDLFLFQDFFKVVPQHVKIYKEQSDIAVSSLYKIFF